MEALPEVRVVGLDRGDKVTGDDASALCGNIITSVQCTQQHT